MAIIQIHGEKFYVGAWWNALEPDKNPSREAQYIAENATEDYDSVLIRKSAATLQAALGNKAKGIKSLASLIADNIEEDNALIRMDFDNGQSWLLIIVDGYIHADEGDFLGTPEEVEVRFKKWLSIDEKWYCSENDLIQTEQVIAEYLEKASSREKQKITFVPIQKWSVPKILSLFLLLLLIFGAAFYAYQEYQVIQKQKETAAILEASNKANHEREALIGRLFPRSWESLPLPSLLMNKAIQSANSIVLIKNGWQLSKWSKTMSQEILAWERLSFGRFIDAPSIPSPGSENTSIETLTELVSGTARGSQAILKKEKAGILLCELGLDLKAPINITWKPIEKQMVEQQEVSSPYMKGDWIFSGMTVLPTGLAQRLDQFPGLTVNLVEWENKTWKISGGIYVRN